MNIWKIYGWLYVRLISAIFFGHLMDNDSSTTRLSSLCNYFTCPPLIHITHRTTTLFSPQMSFVCEKNTNEQEKQVKTNSICNLYTNG